MLNIKNIKTIFFCIICFLFTQTVIADQVNDRMTNDNYIQLTTDNKQKFTVYTVGPENAKKGILLIHGWWGLTHEVETWANQFAVKGYRVMAVDLYENQVTKNPVTAKKLMLDVKQSVADKKYLAAIKALSKPGRKIAIIGRSYGASQALHASLVGRKNISAAILYYPFGKFMTDKILLSSIKAPLLIHFARNDFFLTSEKRDSLTSAIKDAGLSITVNMYKAKHGFDNSTANNYDETSHMLALNRTYNFLKKYLH